MGDVVELPKPGRVPTSPPELVLDEDSGLYSIVLEGVEVYAGLDPVARRRFGVPDAERESEFLRAEYTKLRVKARAMSAAMRSAQKRATLDRAEQEIPSLGALAGELKTALRDYVELASLREKCRQQAKHIAELLAKAAERHGSTKEKPGG